MITCGTSTILAIPVQVNCGEKLSRILLLIWDDTLKNLFKDFLMNLPKFLYGFLPKFFPVLLVPEGLSENDSGFLPIFHLRISNSVSAIFAIILQKFCQGFLLKSFSGLSGSDSSVVHLEICFDKSRVPPGIPLILSSRNTS